MQKLNSDVIETPHGANALRGTGDLLLDSSLIVTTNKQIYTTKIINCNDYIQIYFFPDKKSKKNIALEPLKDNIIKIDTDNLKKVNSKFSTKIEVKNIMRSKLACQRLAKANIDCWNTFITLTFADNVTNIKLANKKFRYFIDKIQRVCKDFKYICIPEFQKRGAVHYHLLTNIKIDDDKLIYSQKDSKTFYHIKYWNEGFTKVDNLKGDVKKIIGYISKYMTKDIDDRLYNCHRYFYSRNLNKPIVSYLNLNDPNHLEYFNNILNKKEVIYENNYLNPYNDETIIFQEYL